jgi:hypothetical protein
MLSMAFNLLAPFELVYFVFAGITLFEIFSREYPYQGEVIKFMLLRSTFLLYASPNLSLEYFSALNSVPFPGLGRVQKRCT